MRFFSNKIFCTRKCNIPPGRRADPGSRILFRGDTAHTTPGPVIERGKVLGVKVLATKVSNLL